MRIMGLDYGSKTVGVAVSDALLLTAQNIETICREQENKLRRTLARIQELCLESGVRREHRKEYVDQIAASMILQGYLDYRKNRSE